MATEIMEMNGHADEEVSVLGVRSPLHITSVTDSVPEWVKMFLA